MIAYTRTRKPAGQGRVSEHVAALGKLYGRSKFTRLPDNWRDHLPDPAAYYHKHVDKLGKPNSSGWAQGRCPFHDDHNASLSVSLSDPHGGFRCFACGEHGDIVTFHRKRTGLQFREAVAELLGVRA